MKAEHPKIPGKFYFFADKNIPFGSGISCSHFQRFSESLRHLVENETGKKYQITNYLDDFLIFATTHQECDWIVSKFLEVCNKIGFPVSLEKTEWSTQRIVFLGVLLDGITLSLAIPEEKRLAALTMVRRFKSAKKATVKELQRLSGHLNFLNKAIVPGRVFTRRMYAKFTGKALKTKSGKTLKYHHHVRLDGEFKADCSMWEQFLIQQNSVNRPFIDLKKKLVATKIKFYSDASAAKRLGMGLFIISGGSFQNGTEVLLKENNQVLSFSSCLLYVQVFLLGRKI